VSYRYPFLDEESGDYVAPVDFQQWDAYQGTRARAIASVTRLLSAVGDRLKPFTRTPK